MSGVKLYKHYDIQTIEARGRDKQNAQNTQHLSPPRDDLPTQDEHLVI